MVYRQQYELNVPISTRVFCRLVSVTLLPSIARSRDFLPLRGLSGVSFRLVSFEINLCSFAMARSRAWL